MPLDDVGSELDLYNTKHTELHLYIYKHKYLRRCVFFNLIMQVREKGKGTQLFNTSSEGGPRVVTEIETIIAHSLCHTHPRSHLPRSHADLDIALISAKSRQVPSEGQH